MENNKQVTLKKIPLQLFIDALVGAWDQGADYVDIIGIPDELQDEISIIIREEYYAEEEADENVSDNYDVEKTTEDPLNDDDLDQLV